MNVIRVKFIIVLCDAVPGVGGGEVAVRNDITLHLGHIGGLAHASRNHYLALSDTAQLRANGDVYFGRIIAWRVTVSGFISNYYSNLGGGDPILGNSLQHK